jgi:hypothetical protein
MRSEAYRFKTALAGLCILYSTQAVAQAPPPAYQLFWILSNGQDSCGEFLAGNPQRHQLDIEWILGYIGGINSRAAPADRMVGQSVRDIAAIGAWVQQYCQSHPLDPIPGAAEALRAELGRREGGTQ